MMAGPPNLAITSADFPKTFPGNVKKIASNILLVHENKVPAHPQWSEDDEHLPKESHGARKR